MRLHRLSVRAFGPFAEPVEVDFDDLAQAGIFLIHGATGSGKTSLLDAVCFALYGRVPGLRPAGETLRSDHAGADDVPEVQLELTVGERRLRVTRSPDHRRPKKRGSGLTPVRGQVRLEQWSPDGGWSTLATRADDVGDSLGRALGMGLDQFAKVVLLPQGDFAAFLRATPEERRTLLERLFDVRRYTDVETWLAERRRHTAAAAARAQAAVAADLVRVDDVLARVPPEVLDGLPTWDEATRAGCLAESVAGVAGRVTTHAVTALATSDAAERVVRAVEQRHAELSLAAVAARRGTAAQAVLSELAARADERSRATERLAQGERAGRVAGDLRALQTARADLDAARTRDASARQALADSAVAVPQSPADALARVRSFDVALGELARLSTDETARSARYRQLSAEFAAAQAQVARIAAAEAATTAEVAAQQARVDELMAAGADCGPAEAQAALAARLVADRADVDRTQAAITSLEAAGLAATRVALAQASRLLDLRQRRLDGMAAELAASLSPGTECPVCGGTEHPRLAQAVDTVTADDVETAEHAWAPLDRRARQLETELAASRQHLDEAMARLDGDDRDQPTLLAAADEAGLRLAAAHAALAELPAVRDAITGLMERRAELATARQDQLASAGRAEALLGELDAASARDQGLVSDLVRRHTEGCPCADGAEGAEGTGGTSAGGGVGGGGDLSTRHSQVEAQLAEAAQAQLNLSEATRRHTDALATTTALCRSEGFDDVTAAEQAALPAAEIEAIRATLATAAAAAETARATLSEPDVAAALAADLPALDEVAAELSVARARRVAAARRHALAEQAARDLEALAQQVSASVDSATAATARADSIAALADVVAGLGSDNTLRMRLSSFVLAGRLERVVELANERLARMGEGRFRLAHTDRLAGGGRRSGLGLQVDDLWTGQTRDTATLSGGESFMASLALALGLADAVREESGGIDLHTLFIDEGFGSLDGESLEEVMEVLDRLQDGGRAVGIVSHVRALRDRIPAQVRVDKTRRGSTVRRVTGPAA